MSTSDHFLQSSVSTIRSSKLVSRLSQASTAELFRSTDSTLSQKMDLDFTVTLRFKFCVNIRRQSCLLTTYRIVDTRPLSGTLRGQGSIDRPRVHFRLFSKPNCFNCNIQFNHTNRSFPLKSPISNVIRFNGLRVRILRLFFPYRNSKCLMPFPVTFANPPKSDLAFCPRALNGLHIYRFFVGMGDPYGVFFLPTDRFHRFFRVFCLQRGSCLGV